MSNATKSVSKSPALLTNQGDILAALAAHKITAEEAGRLLSGLEKPKGHISFKVSEKGGMSVYGMGRFPVTLYLEQWLKLLDSEAEIRAFLQANKGSFKAKNA